MQDHGTLRFKLENSILIVEGSGPWNKEALSLSHKNIRLTQEQRPKDKWGVIIIVHGVPVHTPDAAELLIEQVKDDKKNGRVATAVILNDSMYPELGRRHLSEVYVKAGEIAKFFNNIADAKIWVSSLL